MFRFISGYRDLTVLGAYQSIVIGGVPMALLAETEEEEAFHPIIVLSNLVAILLTVTVAMVVLIAIYVTVRIVAPLRALTRWAQRIAQGELSVKELVTSSNEIGDLNHSFQEVVKSFREVTDVCQAVSVGDYSQSVELRSDNDLLAKSINQMANTLRAVVKQANTIAEGDYSLEIQPRSEKDQLGIALAHMTHRLKSISAENEHQQWFKTGQAELSEQLRGEQNIEQLGNNVVKFLAAYLKADIGAVYFSSDNQLLKLIATYAYSANDKLGVQFAVGEGLVGQAASEQRYILLTDVPDDYPKIKSGLISAIPKQLLIYPLVYEHKVVTVLEFGKLQAFSEDEINFLHLMAESMAIAFISNQARLTLANMLERSQQQADALEQQQHALKQANEDLEQKTKELVTVNQYKSDFLARMSHELRTPLNSILILSKALTENKTTNLTVKQVEHAKVIYSSGSDLLTLINDILDLAKVEAGRLEIIVDKINMEVLGHYLLTSFMPIADDRELSFSVKLQADTPKLIF